jgi:hypothetical protein
MEVVVMQEAQSWFEFDLNLTEIDLMADLDPGFLAWELELDLEEVA